MLVTKLNVIDVCHVASNKTSEVDNADDMACDTCTMTWLVMSLMTWLVTSLMIWMMAAHFRTGLVGPFFDPLWNQSPLNKPINRWAIKLNPICHTIHQNSSPLNWPIKNWAHQIDSNVSSIHQNGHYRSKYKAGQNNRYNLKFTFKRDIPSITFIFHLCFQNQTTEI